MGYYPASGGNFLPKFRDNLLVPFTGIKNPNESLLSQYGVYLGKSVGCGKSQCQPIGLMQVVGRELLWVQIIVRRASVGCNTGHVM